MKRSTGRYCRLLILFIVICIILMPATREVYSAPITGLEMGNPELPALAETGQPLLYEIESAPAEESEQQSAEELTEPKAKEPILYGDTNSDGILSLADLALLAASFEKKAEDMDWGLHQLSDLSEDGIIDIQDAVILAGLILGDPDSIEKGLED